MANRPHQKTPQAPAPTRKDWPKNTIAGRCFITRDQRGRTQRQGIIHCIVPSQQGDLVLIQYFEWMLGAPNTMALVPLASMASHDEKSKAGWVLFEDDAHLRDYMDNVQSYQDRWIDREQTKTPTDA